MGCRESKLAVSTNEPVKKPKSNSSRSTSRMVDRLNSNSTTTSISNSTEDKENIEINRDVVSQDELNKTAESKGCQTTDYCSKEGIVEKTENNGLKESNEGGNLDILMPKKETIEKEEGNNEESIVIDERSNEVESQKIDDQVQETKEDVKDEPNEMNLEVVEKPGQEQNGNDEVKFVKEQEHVQDASDKIEIVEKQEHNEDEEVGEVENQEQNANNEDAVIEKQKEDEDVSDKVEIVEKQKHNEEDEEVGEVEKQEQNANNEDAVIEKQEEDEGVIEPIKVETETVVDEETDKIVMSNEDNQLQVIEQEEDGHKDEEEVETIIADEGGDAPNLNEEVIVEETKEVEPTKVEVESAAEEESDTIMTKNVDNEVSVNVDTTDPNEQKDGTIVEE